MSEKETKKKELFEELRKIYRDEIDEEEEILDHLVRVISLRNAYRAPRGKRTPRAIRLIREYVEKRVKNYKGSPKEKRGEEEEEIEVRTYISRKLNELLWSRGIEKPPKKVRVNILITKPKGEEDVRIIKVFPVIG